MLRAKKACVLNKETCPWQAWAWSPNDSTGGGHASININRAKRDLGIIIIINFVILDNDVSM